MSPINFYYEYCSQDQLLNSTYSQSEFTLDEGEKLLKEMQDLREDLSHYSSVVEALMERSREVVPLKQRRQSLRQPITVTSICNYKQVEVTLKITVLLFINILCIIHYLITYHFPVIVGESEQGRNLQAGQQFAKEQMEGCYFVWRRVPGAKRLFAHSSSRSRSDRSSRPS